MKPTILLASGTYFNLERPNPDDIHIEDIARALSFICRYTGHVRQFYSVAQHCVLASYVVPPHLALEALLHDAPEAYIGDVSAPLKAMLPDYRAVEARVEAAVAERFGLPLVQSPEVKHADLVMLATEKRDLMPVTDEPWPVELTHPALPYHITPMNAEQARHTFLDRFRWLMEVRARVTRYTCAICGRRTTPFVFIGTEAIGPKCAQRAGLTPAKTGKARGHRLSFAKMPVRREAGPQTLDLFEALTKEEDGTLR